MKTNTTVTLSSNGKYWQAFYYDACGRRRAKSLGPKMKLSKRQAKVMCDRLAAELCLNPARAGNNHSPTLERFLERYINNRTDIKPATKDLYEQTEEYLLMFFDGSIRIGRITRAMAADWRAAMASGKLVLNQKGKKNKEASVCIHVRNAKTAFNHAVGEDLIMLNPFDRLKGNAPEPDKNWKYVTLEELDKLLEACSSWGWRMLIALCRLAGLRRGEALELSWSNINWDKHRLTIIAEKTGQQRVTPMEPKLYQLLLDAFDRAENGEERICAISRYCLWRNFQAIRRRAGLEKWKDAFKVMRRNCETDWAQRYPQYAVSAWIGHGIEVSAKHYLQVPEELYDKVAATNEAQTATKTATKPKDKMKNNRTVTHNASLDRSL
ncbi:MAG: tyrosine-type recombinase/integrase [Phycisphaerae bacterium]|nr:tyrosine-type recombinase/integrase [Phycisphaerae bacterium]